MHFPLELSRLMDRASVWSVLIGGHPQHEPGIETDVYCPIEGAGERLVTHKVLSAMDRAGYEYGETRIKKQFGHDGRFYNLIKDPLETGDNHLTRYDLQTNQVEDLGIVNVDLPKR